MKPAMGVCPRNAKIPIDILQPLHHCESHAAIITLQETSVFGRRPKAIPELLPSNPGRGSGGKTSFVRGSRSWSEHFDLVALLASVLQTNGCDVLERTPALEIVSCGFLLLPQLVNLQPLDRGGVRTVSTIQFHHPKLVPGGSFEYQHATGDDLQGSFRSGFDQWAQIDLVTLLDSLREKPAKCTTLKLDCAREGGTAEISRRAVLGPFVHFKEGSKPADLGMPSRDEAAAESSICNGDDFCPCCLLTRSFEAFKKQIQSDGFFGLRLYAARNQDSVPMADCRVNGEDWEDGAVALRKYASTWPRAGFEFRKQYVVLHSV
jgi:hypothetical protein